MSDIRTIYWKDRTVVMIDQKVLPAEERYITCRHHEDVIEAIKDMTIRGAPAIGIAAAMGIALGTFHLKADNDETFHQAFHLICDEFSQTRPTARNLFWAIERMRKRFITAMADRPALEKSRTAEQALDDVYAPVKQALIEESIRIGKEDVAANRRIGLNGRAFIKNNNGILTHCNAGALATAGYGTALGVIRAAHEEGKAIHVFVDETRPVLQGARLTAWELVKDGIPSTLITDNTAGFLMQQGKIDLVIVGADRIAANGDAANKIGTYSLAVLAKAHGIPFYVAAPLSTVDLHIRTGTDIPIEERAAQEITNIQGHRIAPEEIDVYNPAFDVTPGRYITAIITEADVALPPFSENIAKLFPHQSFQTS
ncbi:MAG: S-methyl-5-thioribose-1-phosphate isomerase [Deltaproteobacteria bacterium]|nr:S-methyl-5-thioribose-1-phosphate isomerase [Deltaproteobacteria bacterium]